MNILGSLDPSQLSRLAAITVRAGDVYEITMTQANGITPKPGDDSRDKYFVVLGFDNEGNAYGGVIINSNINQHLPPHLKMLHMPISSAKYSFLHHNSFVDCVMLKYADPKKFNEWRYLGSLDEQDTTLILATIRESPRESKQHLAQFGL